MNSIKYQSTDVDCTQIFYRGSGAPGAPKLLLLHGFPSASHMFRDLIQMLADRFHIVAPDLPGFGRSEVAGNRHTFDRITEVIDRFTEVVGFDRYAVYVFDYGAPTGFRLAVKHPDRITAIISQNGNAYEEGLSDGWNPIRAYWEDPSKANREALRGFLTPEATIWQYTHGVPDPAAVSPDGYSLDNFYLTKPGMTELQLDLFGDYKSNAALYPTFQKYFRTHKPAFLAVWGKNDPFFLPAGARRHSGSRAAPQRHPPHAAARGRIVPVASWRGSSGSSLPPERARRKAAANPSAFPSSSCRDVHRQAPLRPHRSAAGPPAGCAAAGCRARR